MVERHPAVPLRGSIEKQSVLSWLVEGNPPRRIWPAHWGGAFPKGAVGQGAGQRPSREGSPTAAGAAGRREGEYAHHCICVKPKNAIMHIFRSRPGLYAFARLPISTAGG